MKERLTLIYILLILSSTLYAASITSAQTGAADNTTTWVGGVIPGNGDTVIIANGHVVTINAGVTMTWGTSPADDTGAKAVACSSGTGTGSLVIDGTLIFRGPVMACNATWTVNPGATLTHDSSLATTPATANYKWRYTGAANQTGAYLNIIGTPSSRITVNIASGSGKFGGFAPYIDGGADGNLTIKYADLSDVGVTGTTGKAIIAYPFTCSTSVVRGLIVQYSTFTNSGEIYGAGSFGSCTTDIYRNVFSGVTSDYVAGIGRSSPVNNAIATNGLRRFSENYVEGGGFRFDANATNTWDHGLLFDGNYIRSGTTNIPTTFTGLASIGGSGHSDMNVLDIRYPASGAGTGIPAGNISRLVLLHNRNTNAHFSTITAAPITLDGWLTWNAYNGGDNGDDHFLIQKTGTTNYPIVIKNGVTVRRPTGIGAGALVNYNGLSVSPATPCSGANCPQISVNWNTFYVANVTASGMTGVGMESNDGYAGIFDSVRSNIAHQTTSGDAYIIKWSNAQAAVSGIFELANYNWTHNVTTTTATKYYSEGGAYAEYGATPGANDSNGDPLFVDVTRTPVSYGARWDSGVTDLDTLAAKFKACYLYRTALTGTCDARFESAADMYNWVRAGWRARNSATWTAAHDGSHVGGVAPMKTFGVLAQ